MSYLNKGEGAVSRDRKEEEDTVDYPQRDESVSDEETAKIVKDGFFAKYHRNSKEDYKGNKVEGIPRREPERRSCHVTHIEVQKRPVCQRNERKGIHVKHSAVDKRKDHLGAEEE